MAFTVLFIESEWLFHQFNCYENEQIWEIVWNQVASPNNKIISNFSQNSIHVNSISYRLNLHMEKQISFKTKKNSRIFLLSHVYIGRFVDPPPWWRILLILTRTPHFSSLAGARQTTLVYAACRNFSPLAKCIEKKRTVNRLLQPCRTVKWG